MTRAEEKRVEIARATGWPMPSPVGRRPLREVHAFQSQLVERVAPATSAGVVAHGVDWTDWHKLDAPDGARPAAVRITDMLGEEILFVETLP